ncbi:ribonuclease H family protein [Bdellovibrio svalbardensis]|uniref:ribonuclease H n=1 Tax=Bdellovibrio svalbardensis TaxID=2972972 RepID=A0ABT6DHT8_9BACT|nr:ribonuclease H [Bdellovibrio svalbardensis]MDG0816415.1 ribonuclease HI [Bdellovibrio svalbardensis]
MSRAVKRVFQKLVQFICTKDKSPVFEIYTDGSWKAGRGAWAYVQVKNGQITKEDSGPARKTNCTRMEFQAAIEALRSLPLGTKATLYSDSRILVDTMTLWLSDWKQNGWLKKTGQEIPSVDQIKILDSLNEQHSISWRWVRAHAGVVFNERCDQLCIQARTQAKQSP